jgi:predicted amidophosphoribosyltransferase
MSPNQYQQPEKAFNSNNKGFYDRFDPFCNRCGSKIEYDEKYCSNCGMVLDKRS